ncbi:hypothetical protein LQG66_28350 [Bradyrhizobium ontarionense]|uniref:Uncharacterized protein n=1 Tax=Bradyrhizobium ontarionense TaxID=2898149 RepID=A0ABY3R8P7_9BRAD|nr:hypothetical protein [Bradyrhizobium sp. A19]UFZ03123.1 hypothetical protein LQG66_28350 [Bradyrhizobium sp. A19]
MDIYNQLSGAYGHALGVEIIFAATAGWGLETDAKRHEKLAQAMTGYVSEHPVFYTIKLLSGLGPRSA